MKKFINGKMINLAEPKLGSKVIFKTDDFFASANRIINPNPPSLKKEFLTNREKWMDGWETRRRRRKGFDYLIIKFGKPKGKIFKLTLIHLFLMEPTNLCFLEACHSNKKLNIKTKWIKILNKKKLKPKKS
ncbi:MAG: hypothetical protein CM1200mP5_2190 [Candidatus Pelagibacterales bacterium]|nr:MAG: hypothetical protein CM1200mP5_2190 [Pelagibacterales bacterium]